MACSFIQVMLSIRYAKCYLKKGFGTIMDSLRFEKVGAILDLLVLSSFFGSSVITFQMKIYWVPCGPKSSYSFPWNVLKL